MKKQHVFIRRVDEEESVNEPSAIESMKIQQLLGLMVMGVSKNSGTPKWMVNIMENPIKMDDLGGKPTIFGNIP